MGQNLNAKTILFVGRREYTCVVGPWRLEDEGDDALEKLSKQCKARSALLPFQLRKWPPQSAVAVGEFQFQLQLKLYSCAWEFLL